MKVIRHDIKKYYEHVVLCTDVDSGGDMKQAVTVLLPDNIDSEAQDTYAEARARRSSDNVIKMSGNTIEYENHGLTGREISIETYEWKSEDSKTHRKEITTIELKPATVDVQELEKMG